MAFLFNGKIYHNPGVHQVTQIVGGSGIALTEYKVPVLLGSALKGIPWNADDGQDPIRQFQNDYDVGAFYGWDNEAVDDSDMHALAKQYFKGTGIGGTNRPINCINIRPITQCKNISFNAGKLIVDSKLYGPELNTWGIGISVAAGKATATITPVKNVRFIKADVADTGTIVELDDTRPYRPGDTVYLYEANGTGSVKSAALTVSVVGENSITFGGAVGAGPGGVGATSWQASNFAFIYQPDTDNAIISNEFDATYDELDAFLTASGYFIVDKANSTYTAGETFTTIAEGDWESFITAEGDKGQGAAISNVDTSVGIPALINWLEDEIIGPKKLRFFAISNSDCADMGDVVERATSFKDFAYQMNTNHEYRTFWYFGNLDEATDFSLSYPSTDDNDLAHPGNPSYRMGSMYMRYCATKNTAAFTGIDGYEKGYYIAAQCLGEEVGVGPTFHNQTLSRINASQLNTFTKAEEAILNQAGTMCPIFKNTARLNGYYWAKGVNTYMSRVFGTAENEWDDNTNEIGLPHAPHILGHWEQAVRDSLIAIIPNDRSQGKTGPVSAALLNLGRSFTRQEYFQTSEDGERVAFRVSDIQAVPGGVTATARIRIRGVTNDIGITNQIYSS